MEKKGYRVVRLSFIHPEESICYNPLMYLHSTQDIQAMANALVKQNLYEDVFWSVTARMLLCSLIGFLKERVDLQIKDGMDPEKANEDLIFQNILRLLELSKQNTDDCPENLSPLALIMDDMEKQNPGSWAAKQFRQLSVAADKTWNSIAVSAVSSLGTFDTMELRKMMEKDELDIPSIGRQRTAVFVEVSDTDRSMDVLVNLFFTQTMHELCSYADEQCIDSRLPVPVRFIMDDFATNCRIENFENMISNIRSRGISAMIVLQSLSQLEAGYGKSTRIIADDCDTMVYMGGNDPDTAYEIARRCNKTEDTILHMPLGTSWIIRRGQKPFCCRNFDLDDYLKKTKGGRMYVPGGEYEIA